MKKLLTLVALLLLVLAITACSDSPAPLMAPDSEGVSGIDYDADASNDFTLEADDNDYNFDLDTDYGFGEEIWDDMPTFSSLAGEVVEINVDYSDPPVYTFLIKGENGSANLITNFNTFFLGEKPEVGDTITGFYIPEVFMALIYPPQFNTSVIVNGEFGNIAVDRFNEELISYDGFLMLNIGEDTEIILQDGEAFDCELAHRKLVVLYDISTRSIPAMTTPNKIIVLFEHATTGPALL